MSPPAAPAQARLLVQLADYWGAPSLLPACDSFLAMHLRTRRMELLDSTPSAQGGYTYR